MADDTVETVDRILPAAVPLLLLLRDEEDGGGNHRTGAVRTALWSVICRTSLTET